MKSTAILIADTEDTARVFKLYLKTVMAEAIESYFMTYQRTLLSGTLIRQADLFIVELFSMDSIGLRAEGILTAEKCLSLGKRALIISGSAVAHIINNPLYWDLAARDRLNDRIMAVLDVPAEPPSALVSVRATFGRYCRPAEDPHRKGLSTS